MRFVKTAESIWNIPIGFARVEFLESTGTQYIDTGYTLNNNSVIEISAQSTDASQSNNTLLGVGTDGASTDRVQIHFGSSAGYLSIRLDGTLSANQNIGTNRFTAKIDIPNKKAYFNDTEVISTYSGAINETNHIALFNRMINGNIVESTYASKAKVYYLRIRENDTIVHDFIPCIDPLGRPCMYDLVGKKTYYNQGTGEFTVGRQIIPVNYLQSSGTQYIDTNTEITPTTTILIDASLESYAQWTNSCGGIPSARGYFCLPFGWTNSNTRARSIYGTDTVGTGEYDFNYTLGQRIRLLYNDNKKLYIGDTHVFTFNYDKQTPPSKQIFRFGRHSNACGAKFYGVKIWDNGYNSTLVADYIPCKDENNVGFMLDTVSGTVYENAGTGAFVVGQNKYNMKLRLIRDNVLPTGYTQVEYLESSGTQWIDTGVGGDLTTELACEAAIVQAGNASVTNIMGNNVTSTRAITINMSANITNPSPSRIRFGNTDTTTVAGSIDLNTFYKYDTNKNELTVRDSSGTVLNTYAFNATTAFTTNGNILIYKLGDTSTQYIGKIKVKGATIKNSGVLVRNFIPAVDPSGTPCMYDLVSRTPFYNEGTGTFTTGKPVLPVVRFPVDPVPAGYKTVNYLESTGTQYIDTGIKFDGANTKIEVKTYEDSLTRIHSICGDDGNFFYYFKGTTNWAVGYNATAANINSYMSVGDNVFVMDKNNVYVNGVLAKTYTASSSVSAYNALLFNRKTNLVDKGAVTMYYCKIWNNDVLVRNFIPVVRLLDNKAGMWDTVTKQFYTTPVGDFITG